MFIHVKACPGDFSRPERLDQRLFIHHFSSRRIDEESSRLHPSQFGSANHVVRMRGQGSVQAEEIRLAQEGFTVDELGV